jgi:membrane associated rhomboid family serine protease
MHQASVGFHCPECAKKGSQKVYTARNLVTQPYVTFILIAISAAAFVGELLTVNNDPGHETGRLGQIGLDGALYGPDVAAGDWWRPITAGFIHDGPLHIGLNMFILWQLGMLLEPALGRFRFIALYFVSLLGGSLLVLVISPNEPTVGASGAIFGLLGAAFIGLRSRGIDPFQTAIGPLIIINLIFTFVGGNISIGGHIGGLVVGAGAGWLLFELPSRVPNGKIIAPLICVAGSVALFVACLQIAEPLAHTSIL